MYITNVKVALQINILLETIMQKEENILYLYTKKMVDFPKKISHFFPHLKNQVHSI